uniref:Uncharacterized protein n=1 Tax=Oryza meridionalis TaxID=40149 RepID=A0A0E0ERY8_9ORYZ
MGLNSAVKSSSAARTCVKFCRKLVVVSATKSHLMRAWIRGNFSCDERRAAAGWLQTGPSTTPRHVTAAELRETAAIASSCVVDLYGLEVLADGIQDDAAT